MQQRLDAWLRPTPRLGPTPDLPPDPLASPTRPATTTTAAAATAAARLPLTTHHAPAQRRRRELVREMARKRVRTQPPPGRETSRDHAASRQHGIPSAATSRPTKPVVTLQAAVQRHEPRVGMAPVLSLGQGCISNHAMLLRRLLYRETGGTALRCDEQALRAYAWRAHGRVRRFGTQGTAAFEAPPDAQLNLVRRTQVTDVRYDATGYLVAAASNDGCLNVYDYAASLASQRLLDPVTAQEAAADAAGVPVEIGSARNPLPIVAISLRRSLSALAWQPCNQDCLAVASSMSPTPLLYNLSVCDDAPTGVCRFPGMSGRRASSTLDLTFLATADASVSPSLLAGATRAGWAPVWDVRSRQAPCVVFRSQRSGGSTAVAAVSATSLVTAHAASSATCLLWDIRKPARPVVEVGLGDAAVDSLAVLEDQIFAVASSGAVFRLDFHAKQSCRVAEPLPGDGHRYLAGARIRASFLPRPSPRADAPVLAMPWGAAVLLRGLAATTVAEHSETGRRHNVPHSAGSGLDIARSTHPCDGPDILARVAIPAPGVSVTAHASMPVAVVGMADNRLCSVGI